MMFFLLTMLWAQVVLGYGIQGEGVHGHVTFATVL